MLIRGERKKNVKANVTNYTFDVSSAAYPPFGCVLCTKCMLISSSLHYVSAVTIAAITILLIFHSTTCSHYRQPAYKLLLSKNTEIENSHTLSTSSIVLVVRFFALSNWNSVLNSIRIPAREKSIFHFWYHFFISSFFSLALSCCYVMFCTQCMCTHCAPFATSQIFFLLEEENKTSSRYMCIKWSLDEICLCVCVWLNPYLNCVYPHITWCICVWV